MELKCKLKDLVADLVELGVTDIKMSSVGIGDAAACILKEKGVDVKRYHPAPRIPRCTECQSHKSIGKKTNECLDCLDWKMDGLRK